MTGAIAVSIRSVANGYIACFAGTSPGMESMDLIGKSACEIRDAVLLEFKERLAAAMVLVAPEEDLISGKR